MSWEATNVMFVDATVVLFLDAADVSSADTTHVLSANTLLPKITHPDLPDLAPQKLDLATSCTYREISQRFS